MFFFIISCPVTLCEAPTRETRPHHITMCPTLFNNRVGSLMFPASHLTLNMHEMGPTVHNPYPRRFECLTIYRYHYKGSTFFSIILRPWVLVGSGAQTHELEPLSSRTAESSSTDWANQAAGFYYVLKTVLQKICTRSQRFAHRILVWTMESSWICATSCEMFGG